MDGSKDGWMCWVGRWMDGSKDEWMDEMKDKWMDVLGG